MALYHVLMPVDRDLKRVRAQSEAVIALPAVSDSVEVTLFHVFDADSEESSIQDLTVGEEAIEFFTENRTVASLNTETSQGDVATKILNAAETHDVNALVLGGRQRSPMGSLLFGSVTTDVLGNSDRPVMITGDQLVENREDSSLQAKGQDDVYDSPGKDLNKDAHLNSPDFVGEEE